MKTSLRPASARVSWWLETSSIKTPFPGRDSVPGSFVSLFIFYILSFLPSKTMVCFSGRLMSSASDQKLFCELCSALSCSLDEICRGESGLPVLFLRHLGSSLSLYFSKFTFSFFKSLLDFLQYFFCFMFWFFGHKACGILAFWPGILPTSTALEHEVLTTELPGKCLIFLFKCVAAKH